MSARLMQKKGWMRQLRCLEVFIGNMKHNSLLSIIYEKFPMEISTKIEEKNASTTMETLKYELNSQRHFGKTSVCAAERVSKQRKLKNPFTLCTNGGIC